MKMTALLSVLLLATVSYAKPRKIPTAPQQEVVENTITIKASATSYNKEEAESKALESLEDKVEGAKSACDNFEKSEESSSVMKIGRPGSSARKYLAKVKLTANCE